MRQSSHHNRPNSTRMSPSSSPDRAHNLQDFTPTRPSPLSHLAFSSRDPDCDLTPLTNASLELDIPIDPLLLNWPDDNPDGWPESDDLDEMFGPLSPSPTKARDYSLQDAPTVSQNSLPSGSRSRQTQDLRPPSLDSANSRCKELSPGASNEPLAGSLSSRRQLQSSSDSPPKHHGFQASRSQSPDTPSHPFAVGGPLYEPLNSNRLSFSPPQKHTTRLTTNQQQYMRPSLPSNFMARRALSLSPATASVDPKEKSKKRASSMTTTRPELKGYPHKRAKSNPANGANILTSTATASLPTIHRPFTLVCHLCELPFRPSADTLRPDTENRAYCSECIRAMGDRVVEEQKIRLGVGRKGTREKDRQRIKSGGHAEDSDDEEDEEADDDWEEAIEDDDDEEMVLGEDVTCNDMDVFVDDAGGGKVPGPSNPYSTHTRAVASSNGSSFRCMDTISSSATAGQSQSPISGSPLDTHSSKSADMSDSRMAELLLGAIDGPNATNMGITTNNSALSLMDNDTADDDLFNEFVMPDAFDTTLSPLADSPVIDATSSTPATTSVYQNVPPSQLTLADRILPRASRSTTVTAPLQQGVTVSGMTMADGMSRGSIRAAEFVEQNAFEIRRIREQLGIMDPVAGTRGSPNHRAGTGSGSHSPGAGR